MCQGRGASFRAELAAVRACEPGDFSSSADGSSFCAWLRSGAGASCLHGSDGRAREAAQLAGSGGDTAQEVPSLVLCCAGSLKWAAVQLHECCSSHSRGAAAEVGVSGREWGSLYR